MSIFLSCTSHTIIKISKNAQQNQYQTKQEDHNRELAANDRPAQTLALNGFLCGDLGIA
jgi:hypothetical protein